MPFDVTIEHLKIFFTKEYEAYKEEFILWFFLDGFFISDKIYELEKL